MIDLTEVVVKASKKGVKLFATIEEYGGIRIRATRGNLQLCMSIDHRSVREMRWKQKEWADRTLEEILSRIDAAEEKAIREGDLGIIC